MLNLIIKEINGGRFTLVESKTKRTYYFSLTFYGLQKNVEIGDCIVFNEKLLDKNFSEYSDSYQFGPLDEPYGRKIKSEKDVDLISVTYKNNKIVLLKRFFG